LEINRQIKKIIDFGKIIYKKFTETIKEMDLRCLVILVIAIFISNK